MTRDQYRAAVRKAAAELAHERENFMPAPPPKPFRGGRHRPPPSRIVQLDIELWRLTSSARERYGEELWRELTQLASDLGAPR